MTMMLFFRFVTAYLIGFGIGSANTAYMVEFGRGLNVQGLRFSIPILIQQLLSIITAAVGIVFLLGEAFLFVFGIPLLPLETNWIVAFAIGAGLATSLVLYVWLERSEQRTERTKMEKGVKVFWSEGLQRIVDTGGYRYRQGRWIRQLRLEINDRGEWRPLKTCDYLGWLGFGFTSRKEAISYLRGWAHGSLFAARVIGTIPSRLSELDTY